MEAVRLHCEPERDSAAKPDPMKIRCGSPELVFPIVDEAIGRLEKEGAIERYKETGISFSRFVGLMVTNATAQGFSEQMALKIISEASKRGLTMEAIENIRRKYPKSVANFYAPRTLGLTPKNLFVGMAKFILWAEAFTFLRAHGYAFDKKD